MAGIAAKLARDREAADGLGSHERAVKYLNQDYEALRAECLGAGALFQDPAFPAVPAALGFKELGPHSGKTQGIVWRRPTVGAGFGVRGAGPARGHPARGAERTRRAPEGPIARAHPRGCGPVTRCRRPPNSPNSHVLLSGSH